MEKLKATIEKYRRWRDLSIYVERMEAHIETDFSISVTNAKSLLETIGKEICNQYNVELKSSPSVNSVLKNAFSALGYSNTNLVSQISSSLATIGQEVGNLRNDVSIDAHGKTLDELRERNNKVDLLTREFLIDSTLVVAVFLIRAFESKNETEIIEKESLDYEESTEFNDFWDGFYGEFEMGDYSFTASEILYGLDSQAYEAEYKNFIGTQDEMEEGEE